MRTIIYIDGFNLYFGCLKVDRAYRWLDVEALAELLCKVQTPQADVVEIKYFTAPVRAGLSPRGDTSCKSQQDYLLALKTHCKKVETILGRYFIVPGSYYPDTNPISFDKNSKVAVLRPEEKQTDVNIALHMLCDATDEKCEQQILMSNDSDCTPILRTIQERHPNIQLGVITPIRADGAQSRLPSKELRKYAHWVRRSIQVSELQACQLPEKVRTRKRTIKKPAYWI